MKQELITVDGKIIITEEGITHKKIIRNVYGQFLIQHFIFLLFYIGYAFWSASNGSPKMWVYVLIGTVWIWPHLERIYEMLFIKTWKRKVMLIDIKSISPKVELNSLETKVILKLKSGREKHFMFRSAENQIDPFMNLLKENQCIENQ